MYNLGSPSLRYNHGYFGTIHGSLSGSADTLAHRLYFSPLPDSYLMPPADVSYSFGGPSNRWKKGFIRDLWGNKIYGTSGPGSSLDSAFISKMMGRASHADTSDTAGVAAQSYNSHDSDSLGGRHTGTVPDTADPALHWGKVGGDLKRTRIYLKDSTGVDVTIAGDTVKVSLEPTVSLDTMKAKRDAFDTLAVGWTVPKHIFGNGGANLTDTTLVVGLITSDCIAVGCGYRYDSGASTYNALQIRFAVVDTFYIYRTAVTDPDSLENFTILKKK